MSDDASRSRRSVLVLTSTLPRWDGDPEPRFVLDLARAIGPRFRTVILAPMAPGAAAQETMEGVEVRRFRYAPLRGWERLAAPGAILPNLRARPWLTLLVPAFFVGQLIALIRTLRHQSFDSVHCHWIVPQGLTMAICSVLMRAPPFLLTCHGTDVYSLNSRWLRAIKRRILRRADAVTVVSREIATFLAAHVDPPLIDRCRHIPMGVDIDLFERSGAPGQMRAARILYAGRLSEGKGVEYLLRAVATPQMSGKEVEVRIAGDGPLRRELEELARTLRIADRVSFLGPLPHHRLAAEMASATIFCLPSIVDRSGAREGMPTVLLEAAAASVPIIASNIGGCGALITSGHSGWLVPPADAQAIADAFVYALAHPDIASRMAAEARNRVREYSWSRIGALYADQLEAIMGEGSTRDSAI